jgi:threonine/homoserine/homoserine lactone efflux protein
MDTHSWLTFCIATFLICAAPGPNMLHMMTSGAKYGFRRTFYSMAGCFLAVALMIGTSVAGIGAVLKASPYLFTLLRYAGAAYLIYIGIAAWRAPASAGIDAAASADLTAASPGRIFRNGFLIGISNPKALLFAGAFFPQFINAEAPELPQLVILFVTFTVLEVGWYMAYALGGNQIASLLRHAVIRRNFNRAVGTLFGFFGLMLIARSA